MTLHGEALLFCILWPLLGSVVQDGQTDERTVRQFGAKGDCKNDDTSAIREAVAATSSLYFPPGCYRVSDSISLIVGHSYRGAGETVSYLSYSGTRNSRLAVLTGANGVLIEDLGIRSVPSAGPAIGIDTNGANGVVIEHVGIRTMRYIGVSLNGSNNTVRNSIIDGNKFGVSAGGDSQTISGNYISNHYSTSNEAAAPWNSRTSQFWDGIVSEGLTNSLITGNTVEDNGQSGIYTGGNGSLSHGNRILRNVVRRNWNRGIDQGVTGIASLTNGVGEIVIEGNTIVDNRTGNLWLAQVVGATVYGNTIETTSAYKTFFRSQAVTPVTSRPDAALAVLSSGQRVAHILFTGNTITASNPNSNCVSLNMGLGDGNMVGNNTRNGNCNVYLSDSVNLKQNAITETGASGNAVFVGELTLSNGKGSDTLQSAKVHPKSHCFFRSLDETLTSSSQLEIRAAEQSVSVNHPDLATVGKLSIWCIQP